MTSYTFSCLLKHFTDTTPAFSICSDTVNKWELLGAFTIVPGDPALIRSDNTVRNGISTIGLQSLSSQSKGLLKHSAAQHCSLFFSLFFSVSLLPSTRFFFTCFPLSQSFSLPLCLSIPSDSPHPSFVKRKESMNTTHRLWVARCTATLLPPDFFHQVNHSIPPFFLSTGNSGKNVLSLPSFYLQFPLRQIQKLFLCSLCNDFM